MSKHPLIKIAILCLGFSILATVPFFFMGQPPDGGSRLTLRMPDTHDMSTHLYQLDSFYKGLQAGSVYPRWGAEKNQGYGTPTTEFYPPGVYYIVSGFYLPFKNWLLAILAAHLFMMIASAVAIFLYSRQMMMSRAASTFVMIAYIGFPYHLIDQYQRGALAELASFVWMPLLLLFAERLFARRTPAAGSNPGGGGTRTSNYISNPGTSSPPLVNRRRTGAGIMLSMAGMALSYAAFCWSHPPTAYQFSLVLGIYVLILSITRKDWKGLVYTGAAIAMGLALSAAYLYPAFAEKDLIWSAVLARDFPYDGTYVFTSGDAFFTLINRSWTLNLVAILVCGAGLLVLARRRIRGGLYPLASRVRLWVAIGAFATFMMTRYSDQIGCRIPMLTIGVFSWRMLSITTLIAALLIGACVEAASIASVARTKARYALLATAAVLVITAAAFTIARVIAPVYSAPLVDQDTEQLDDTILPRTVHVEPEDLPQSDPATLANGNGQVAVKQWAPQHRQLSVDLSDRDQLAIRTFNFPGWTATVDGQKAELGTGEDLGEITLNLERGKHLITLDYLETPLRRRADAVTLFAFFVVFGAIGVACGIKWRERRARVHLDWAPDRSLEFASDTEIVAVTDAGRAEPASVRVKQGAP